MVTDAAKRANYKYVKNNYYALTIKFPKEKADLFRQAAAANGDSMRNILLQAIDNYISDHAGDIENAPNLEN